MNASEAKEDNLVRADLWHDPVFRITLCTLIHCRSLILRERTNAGLIDIRLYKTHRGHKRPDRMTSVVVRSTIRLVSRPLFPLDSRPNYLRDIHACDLCQVSHCHGIEVTNSRPTCRMSIDRNSVERRQIVRSENKDQWRAALNRLNSTRIDQSAFKSVRCCSFFLIPCLFNENGITKCSYRIFELDTWQSLDFYSTSWYLHERN